MGRGEQRLRQFWEPMVGQGVTAGDLRGGCGSGRRGECLEMGQSCWLCWGREGGGSALRVTGGTKASSASVPLSPPSTWPLGAARPSSAGPAAPEAAASLPAPLGCLQLSPGVGEGRSLPSPSPPLLRAWVKAGLEEAGSCFSRYRQPRLTAHRAVKSSDPFTKEVERPVGVGRRAPSFPRAVTWPCRPEPVASGRLRT